MRVTFQNFNEAAQVALLSPLTREVLEYIRENLWPAEKRMDINEIARGPFDSNWKKWSLHCQAPPFQAVDVRLVGVITMPEEKSIVAGVEERWIYDPNRPSLPVALVHDPRHLHIQTKAGVTVRV